MKMLLSLALTLALTLTLSLPANALPQIKPAGVSGAAGAGFAKFYVDKPRAGFKLDQGTFAGIFGEKGFGVMNLYLTLSLNYLTSTGQLNYDYTTLSGAEHYVVNDVNFKLDLFQAGLGLKFKLIDGYFFRPYAEAGGVGGYYQLNYTNKKDVMATFGNNYKTQDSIIDGGWYTEGGVEVSFSNDFGIKAAYRNIDSETKEVDTLNKQKIKYKAEVFYFGLLKNF